MIILPISSRDYKSKKAMLKDWEAGKDFLLRRFDARDTYISIRDSKGLGCVNFRYLRFTRVFLMHL